MLNRLEGKLVVVRSNMSGVWIGVVVNGEVAANGEFSVVLADAAKIHEWSGCAATSGLALYGPGPGSRVCEDVPLVAVGGCDEVIPCTPECAKTMADLPRWKVGR